MTHRSSNQSTKSATMKGLLAGAALMATGLVSAPAAADALGALNDDIMLLIAQMESAEAPLSFTSSTSTSTDGLAGRIAAFEAQLDAIGAENEGFSTGDSDSYQYNVWDTLVRAKTAHDILYARCVYMRDHAAFTARRPSLQNVAERLQALETGSRQVAPMATHAGRASIQMVEQVLADIDQMLAILQNDAAIVGDPGTDGYQYNVWDLHLAVSDIHDRAVAACPAP
jgi:hypothetical protein